jgi:phosphoribosyl-AMP cyclohydrolase
MTDASAIDWLDQVRWDDRGLVCAIAQDAQSGRVLMVAWMNREALTNTVKTQQAVYFSRSRNRLWHKGEESGHFQHVQEIRLDCDGDVILLKVVQQGGIACHTGRESCLYQQLEQYQGGWRWISVDPVVKDPATLYAGYDSPSQKT